MEGKPTEMVDIIKAAAAHYFPDLIQKTRDSNLESRDVLKTQGVSFVETTEDVIQTLEKHRDSTINKVTGSSFSKEAYQILQSALSQYRSNGN